MKFTERTALEKGFAARFDGQVRPALMALESERKARLSKARRLGALVALGFFGLAGLFTFVFPNDWGPIAAVFVIIIGGIAVFGVRNAQSAGWSGAVAKAVMPAICDHIGDLSYTDSKGQGFPLADMRALGVVGSYSASRLRDDMHGTYRGTAFQLVEAYLTKKTRDSDGDSKTKTVFKGLLFHIGVPITVPTPILISRDYGAIGNALGTLFTGGNRRGMPRVELTHKAFDAAFEVHAADPKVALEYLPDLFLDNLLAIGNAEGGTRGAKSMTAGFRGDSFYLALSRSGDFLKMGSLTTPVADMEEDLHMIFADIEIIHRIIDRLHGV